MGAMPRRSMRAPQSVVAALVAALPFALALAATGPIARTARAETPAARVPAPLDGIAAVVGDAFVFRSDVERRARPFHDKLPKDPLKRRVALAELHAQTLERIIDEHLIAKDAKALALTVEDADVSAAIDAIAKANGIDRKKLEAEVLRQGFTFVEYEEEVRRQVLEQRWILVRIRSKIDPKAATNPAMFQVELEKHRIAALAELRARTHVEVR